MFYSSLSQVKSHHFWAQRKGTLLIQSCHLAWESPKEKPTHPITDENSHLQPCALESRTLAQQASSLRFAILTASLACCKQPMHLSESLDVEMQCSVRSNSNKQLRLLYTGIGQYLTLISWCTFINQLVPQFCLDSKGNCVWGSVSLYKDIKWLVEFSFKCLPILSQQA